MTCFVPNPNLGYPGLTRLSIFVAQHRKQRQIWIGENLGTSQYIASRRVQFNGRRAQVSACAVYNSPQDADFFAVYASNDLSISGADLWEYSRARWHIEEMFRTLKQCLGFLKLPLRGMNACYSTICIPFALLASLQLEPALWGGVGVLAVGQIVRQFRQRAMWEAFETMARGEKRMSILMLKTRRLRPENRKKPTNPSADEACAARFKHILTALRKGFSQRVACKSGRPLLNETFHGIR